MSASISTPSGVVFRSSRDEHLFGPGPKRILSLDGGGTRGIITVAFLERLESMLRERYGAGPEFRLADYFDLIGGTSTGAVIATALALGMSTAEVKRFYLEFVPFAFRTRFWRIAGLFAKYETDALMKQIRDQVGDRTIESPDLRTGLAIMTKRMDTGAPWILLNSPRARFWDDPSDGSYMGNRHYSLAKVVRASTAAPYYFVPERLQIADGEPPGLFIDGGVTPHNNPSLHLLMLARMKGYGLEWATGADRLLLVSVGTGSYRPRLDPDAVMRSTSIGLAVQALTSVVQDSQRLVLTMMQWLSDPVSPWRINSEIDDLRGELLAGDPLLSFQRYDISLEADWLAEVLGEAVAPDVLAKLRMLDGLAQVPLAEKLGQKAAALQVRPEHFPPSFDPVAVSDETLRADTA
jgi:hypothetical protein